MTNHMKDVAKLLGVEIGESFRLERCDGEVKDFIYKLTDNGRVIQSADGEIADYLWVVCYGYLEQIITGYYKIVKLPFKPKEGEYYWTYDGTSFTPYRRAWQATPTNYCRLNSNMVFRTEEEAKRERPRIYEECTGKEWTEDYDD